VERRVTPQDDPGSSEISISNLPSRQKKFLLENVGVAHEEYRFALLRYFSKLHFENESQNRQ
jgi:hypothetical protein